MTEPNPTKPLPASAGSAAVGTLGWRDLLGTPCNAVPVPSLTAALRVAATATQACADLADGHLRPDRVELSLQTKAIGDLTELDAVLAERISRSRTEPTDAGQHPSRPVQMLEIAIDALDIPTIRPFWKALLAYQYEPGRSAPGRPDRNRIHLDDRARAFWVLADAEGNEACVCTWLDRD